MGLVPKSDVPDSDYLFLRAETEAAHAACAGPEAALAHQRLASEYLDQLFGDKSGLAHAAESRRRERQEAIASIFSALEVPDDTLAGELADLLVCLA
ncbi:hypothetical protein [Allosphingosinicella deserti]|uniref:Uncharacterized protein n=1 Tax=Allosphingosinicella deserti TaxID=2116704 RepID=A0A2P7QNA8_9SPHN|nr:hypothetical protein [Sphingomonas deserti]PSJ39459.1 hypothetical protein C7I55_12665 [Sphingomonas deserti]